jgi:hypothetical protein
VSITVLVPWSDTGPERAAAWAWVRSRYESAGLHVVTGHSDASGFSRTGAILDARGRTDADVLIVADADVWCDDVDELVAQAFVHGWAIPNLLYRLSAESTDQVLAGASWRGLPLSTDNPQDSQPYRVHPAGTLLALTAETFDAAPPDPRFVGWGQEDDAWAITLRTLVGPPTRIPADVVHLWHPPQPRRTRVVGNEANVRLLRRYQRAQRRPDRIRALLEEANAWVEGSPPG